MESIEHSTTAMHYKHNINCGEHYEIIALSNSYLVSCRVADHVRAVTHDLLVRELVNEIP